MKNLGGSINLESIEDSERRLKAKKYYDSIFEGIPAGVAERKEREKTPEEIEIINLANIYTNALRAKYGLDDFDVPIKNIHVIPNTNWDGGKMNGGNFCIDTQRVEIREAISKMIFFCNVFHELTHFKSFNKVRLAPLDLSDVNPHTGEFVEDEPKVSEDTVGISTDTVDGYPNFYSLNEGITEEVVVRNIWRAFSHPAFEDEVLAVRNFFEENNKSLPPVASPAYYRIVYAGVREPSLLTRIVGKIEGKEYSGDLLKSDFSYPKERELLHIFTKKLAERSPEQYKDQNAAFEEFEKGMMIGVESEESHLVESIEKVFGAGTWDRLGSFEDIDEKLEWAKSL